MQGEAKSPQKIIYSRLTNSIIKVADNLSLKQPKAMDYYSSLHGKSIRQYYEEKTHKLDQQCRYVKYLHETPAKKAQ